MTMTTATWSSRVQDRAVNNEYPHPAAEPAKRRFSNSYKLRILAAYETQPDSKAGESLLHRASIYCSHVVDCRKTREADKLGELNHSAAASLKELEKLRRHNKRLGEQVEKYKLVLDMMPSVIPWKNSG